MDIKSITKVYVHAGEFNTDDIVSAAMIKAANPDVVIARAKSKSDLLEGELCLGLGGTFDCTTNRCQIDEYGNRYSLSTYAFEWCADVLLRETGIVNIEVAKDIFYATYIKKITLGTLKGFHRDSFFRENRILLGFNSRWYEEADGVTNSDKQFFKAVDFMMIVLENWLRQTKEDSDMRELEDEIWHKAEETSEEGIYVLERHIPWQYQVKKDPDTKAKIIIFESNRGGYSVVSKSTDELKIQDSEYLSFLHPSGFMGVADTLSNAVLAAKKTLSSQI